MSEEPLRIKRYPNRRFYDTELSKYVTLRDIEQRVRDGRKVEIVESQTGEDTTRAVLTQIILDRQPEKMALFPVDMLHSIVRSNDVVAGFLRDYFQNSLTYLQYLQNYGTGGAAQDLANPMHWMKAWLDGMRPDGAPPEEVERPATQGGEVEEPSAVEKKLAELEARLRQVESGEE